MPKVEIPDWISPPRLMALKCTYISERNSSPEHIVRFEVGGKSYTSVVPTGAVDPVHQRVFVYAIGASKDGSYLLDLPSDTFTTGSRIKVSRDAPELIYDLE